MHIQPDIKPSVVNNNPSQFTADIEIPSDRTHKGILFSTHQVANSATKTKPLSINSQKQHSRLHQTAISSGREDIKETTSRDQAGASTLITSRGTSGLLSWHVSIQVTDSPTALYSPSTSVQSSPAGDPESSSDVGAPQAQHRIRPVLPVNNRRLLRLLHLCRAMRQMFQALLLRCSSISLVQ